MINLKKKKNRMRRLEGSVVTNGPSDMEQTVEGNLDVDDSSDEIVGRRKFSELLASDG